MYTFPSRRSLLALGIIALLLPALSSAKPITVKFTGRVASWDKLVVPQELRPVVSKGDVVIGGFTYDPSFPDQDASPDCGIYRHTGPGFRMWAQIGRAHLESSPAQPNIAVQVWNDAIIGTSPAPMDQFGVMSASNSALAPSSVVPARFQLMLSDATCAAFRCDAVPNISALLARFEPRHSLGQVATAVGQSPEVLINFTIETMAIESPLLPFTLDLGREAVNPRSVSPWIVARLHPMGFDIEEIDLTSLVLANGVTANPRHFIVGDYDRDGIAELSVRFSRADLLPRLGRGVQEVTMAGQLKTGEGIVGTDLLRVMSPSGHAAASVSPNPLNPAGTLSFRTSEPGPVTVRLFDAGGRLVRTLLRSRILPAGTHEASIDGRDERGQPLAGGVYYFRVEAGDEIESGSVVLLK